MSICYPEDSFNVKLINALGIKQEYITDIRILSHTGDMVIVKVEYLLSENDGENLIELLQEYYLVEKKDNEKK